MVDEFLDENAEYASHQRNPTAHFPAQKVLSGAKTGEEHFRTANFHNYLGANNYLRDSSSESECEPEAS